MAWNGEELVLFDHELVPNPGGEGSPVALRGAALDLENGTWRVLEDSEAESAGLVWTVDRGWVVDLALADTQPAEDDQLAGALGEFGARYYGPTSGLVLDTTTGSWLRMPELEGMENAGTTEVMAGTDLFVFLGSSWPEGDEDGKLSADAWLWSPRP